MKKKLVFNPNDTEVSCSSNNQPAPEQEEPTGGSTDGETGEENVQEVDFPTTKGASFEVGLQVGPMHVLDTMLLDFRNCSLKISQETKDYFSTQRRNISEEGESSTRRIQENQDKSHLVILPTLPNQVFQRKNNQVTCTDHSGGTQLQHLVVESSIMADQHTHLGLSFVDPDDPRTPHSSISFIKPPILKSKAPTTDKMGTTTQENNCKVEKPNERAKDVVDSFHPRLLTAPTRITLPHYKTPHAHNTSKRWDTVKEKETILGAAHVKDKEWGTFEELDILALGVHSTIPSITLNDNLSMENSHMPKFAGVSKPRGTHGSIQQSFPLISDAIMNNGTNDVHPANFTKGDHISHENQTTTNHESHSGMQLKATDSDLASSQLLPKFPHGTGKSLIISEKAVTLLHFLIPHHLSLKHLLHHPPPFRLECHLVRPLIKSYSSYPTRQKEIWNSYRALI